MSKNFVRPGLIVGKVHKIISFKQSDWLQKNRLSNTKKEATDAFEKDF